MKGERALVTGGGGFLGFAVVKRLVERGAVVRTFSRSRYPELDALGVEQVRGDICDPDAVFEAVSGCGTVFHTAARPGVWGMFSDFYNPNVLGTKIVVAACRAHNVSRLVHTSSPSVVFDGNDMEGADESAPYATRFLAHYPRTKAEAERIVHGAATDRLRVVILRPHLIWGPRDNHLVPRIIARARRLARIGSKNPLVDTVYIDNAADAHVLAAERLRETPAVSGKTYFISQGQPVPLWDMVNRILAAAGKKPVTRTVPFRAAYYMGAACEMLYALLSLKGEPPLTRFVVSELGKAHWFDISAARRDLGYEPKVSIDEGLERLEEWLKEHPAIKNGLSS